MSQQAKTKARSPEQIGADIADRFAGLMMSEQRALAEKIAEVIKAERSAHDALVKALEAAEADLAGMYEMPMFRGQGDEILKQIRAALSRAKEQGGE